MNRSDSGGHCIRHGGLCRFGWRAGLDLTDEAEADGANGFDEAASAVVVVEGFALAECSWVSLYCPSHPGTFEKNHSLVGVP